MAQAFNTFYAGSGMKPNAFLPRGFGSAADRLARTQSAAKRRVSPEILATLRSQNEALPPSIARERHLQWLAEGNTAVVATGQQVGLFLGPLYTVFKAASAIAVARTLSAETGQRCVPLFWLQTEDHDFAEVATSHVPMDGAEPLRLTLAQDPELEGCSLAERLLGDDVRGLIDDLEPALAGLDARTEVIDLLRTHYRAGVSPGHAFAGVLASLFAEDGLVVFDPRCAATSRSASPIIRHALTDAPRIDAVLAERGQALREAGFVEQIEPREGSPLAFFHSGSARGPRYRLGRCSSGYELLGANETVTEEVLLATLEHEPTRFSTSALLRPIVQDTILPTVAYVGGPAEVNYFAQLSPLYELFGVEMPLVVERSHFQITTPRVRNLLEMLELAVSDLAQPRDVLVKKLAKDSPNAPRLEWGAELGRRLEALVANSAESDSSIVKEAVRLRESMRHGLDRLTTRYDRAVVERDHVLTTRLSRLQGWLYPEGHPQERVFSFPAFAARVGLESFHRYVMAAVDPFSSAMREIAL